ncbi:TIGR04168 family protein [Cyanobium sp. CH-040]|uniref:TIGR04168 family protein n=1 Tax=Cyanobium sp. CH-040 TaxID=2823708 RepID=UPI0020CE4D9C|nr:TIGR04168 family protein [Cyanobium sp. CH-040]MCP9927490.1 TIGR04168 family protein [Cyanobium sp. CH-040]
MTVQRLAVVGDPHGAWDGSDAAVLARVAPDALLVVGDLSDGQPRIPALLRRQDLPTACILGNHDAGRDPSGRTLRRQIDALGEIHCGWGLRELRPPGLAVVGARPGTAGGGFHLSRAVQAAFGPLSLEESAERITAAALRADPALPLVVLAHCGPAGLGSTAADPCGRDWKKPACDWGDQDLAVAIRRIQALRPLPLVVFGHMHHQLRRGLGVRRSLCVDRSGTVYLNAASVPRHGVDAAGRDLRHFSWVELEVSDPWRPRVLSASHRWFGLDGRLLYMERLHCDDRPRPSASELPLPC